MNITVITIPLAYNDRRETKLMKHLLKRGGGGKILRITLNHRALMGAHQPTHRTNSPYVQRAAAKLVTYVILMAS